MGNVGLCSESQQTKLPAFEGQKFFFDGQTAAVSGEPAVGADDAMAGDDDGNGIGAVGQSHSARGVGVADAASEFAVGDGFTVRDFNEFAPDFLLEWCAFRC